MASIATLERIPAAKLRDLLLAEKADDPKVAVVDVRDDGLSIHLFFSHALTMT